MSKKSKGSERSLAVMGERNMAPPHPPPRGGQQQVPTLPRLPLKDLQRGGGVDELTTSSGLLVPSGGRAAAIGSNNTDHTVFGAPDAISTHVADHSMRSRRHTSTKGRIPMTARADLGYSLVATSGEQQGSTINSTVSGNNNHTTVAPSGGTGTLGADYVHDLKARMKMIGGIVAKSNRTDPISAWPLALPQHSRNTSVNEKLTTGTGKVTLTSSCRPPLALEIESFIRKEVQNLTRGVPRPSILQLIPIYREAFGCFVTHFNEYGPTLSLIQKHYDAAIDSLGILQQRVDKTQTELYSLKETFHIMVESEKRTLSTQLNDVKIQLSAQLKIDAERRDRLLELEHLLNRVQVEKKDKDVDNEELYERNRSLSSQMREQQTKAARLVAKCDKLAIENDRLLKHVASIENRLIGGEVLDYTDEAARGKKERATALQRKSVAVMKNSRMARDSNSLRDRGAESIALHGGGGGLPDGGEHDVSFDASHHLHPTRRGTRILSSGLSDSTAAAEDHDTEEVADADELRDLLYEKEAEHNKLMKANGLLLAEQRVLEQRIDKLQQSKDEDILTPRPRWVAATEAMPNFTPNQLQSSEEILDDLISHFKERLRDDRKAVEMKAYSSTVRQWLSEEDMCEGDLVGKGKNFVCKGTGPHVPMYLRYKGFTKNQRMKKGDVENLLARFWQDRRTRIRADSHLGAQPIDEFYYEWLRNQTPSHKHAINLAYNIHAVCEANQHDPDCSMILRVLRGEISEMAVFDQLDLVMRLKEIVAHHDKTKKGYITRPTFQRILNKFFTAKSMDDMLHLRFALIRFTQGSNVVDYQALFSEDEEGNQTKFVELMRTQHVHEIASFVVEVEEAIREVINTDEGTITFGSARTSVKYIDNAMPAKQMDEMLAFGCKMTVEELQAHGEHFSVPAEPLLARIRTGVLLKRHTRREVDSDAEAETSSNEDEDENENADGGMKESADGSKSEKEKASDDGAVGSERDAKSPTAASEEAVKERVKRRKKIEESGQQRAQRQEDIKELLKDLNIDATGERSADVGPDRRPVITTNEFGEVSVRIPTGAGFLEGEASLLGHSQQRGTASSSLNPKPLLANSATATSGSKLSIASPFGGGGGGGKRSSAVENGTNSLQGTPATTAVGGSVGFASPTNTSFGDTGNFSPTGAALSLPGVSSLMDPDDNIKEAERQKKRDAQERRAIAAEQQLAAQETKMKSTREKDEKEVTDMAQWSAQFGVAGGLNVENLTAAKKATKEMEEAQTGKTFHWDQGKDSPGSSPK